MPQNKPKKKKKKRRYSRRYSRDRDPEKCVTKLLPNLQKFPEKNLGENFPKNALFNTPRNSIYQISVVNVPSQKCYPISHKIRFFLTVGSFLVNFG